MGNKVQNNYWFKLHKVRTDRDIFDLLTVLIAIAALIMPFILRSCEKPKVDLSCKFIYKINFETYPQTYNSFLNRLQPTTKDINDKLDPSDQNIKGQFEWLYQLRLFEIKAKNVKNFPVSLDQLKIEKLEYEPPMKYLSVAPTIVAFLEDNQKDLSKSYEIKLASGEALAKYLIVGFILVIEHRTPTADTLFKESINRLLVLEDSLSRVSSEFPNISNQTLLIGAGKRYEYLREYVKYKDGAPFVYSEIYKEYFSKVKFQNIRFSFVDNAGNKHKTNIVKF